MLKLNDIHTYYGKIHALKGISLHVDQGEIVTLIGANGAGKSTTLMSISGVQRPKKGSIEFLRKNITGLSTNKIVERGLTQVPEGRMTFPVLTVEENLKMGAYLRKDKAGVRKDMDMVYDTFPVLAKRRKQHGGTLSGGEQQMLVIGRALMARPKLLLLDEPSLGLAPIIVENIFSVITQINKSGTTIMLVEQNAQMALACAHRAYVLATGKIIMQGSAKNLLKDPKVQAAYLGTG